MLISLGGSYHKGSVYILISVLIFFFRPSSYRLVMIISRENLNWITAPLIMALKSHPAGNVSVYQVAGS